ncbi:MAG: peptide chain release factor N(5)-glutamine methyltransferase [Propionibacteriaceae bacterium]|nr:peptide chain release factor N(5)-glutamine methyltransferase [Propionibacteriaceae bacterium]
MTSALAVLATTRRTLADAGVDSPQADARTLMCAVLGIEATQLPLVDHLTDVQESQLNEMVNHRIQGTPVQHITSTAHFRTVSVQVGPGVFIPRPETEALAGWAIDQVRTQPRRVVELCAGSGALSLAIHAESCPAAQWAVELSTKAFTYLEKNLVGTPIVPVLGDMSQALAELEGTIDLVVANPPYVPTTIRKTLTPEVLADPDLALFAGEDGYKVFPLVAHSAARLLAPGGVVGCEHGDGQERIVTTIFTEAGFTSLASHKDLTGRPRFITAMKPNMQ